LNSWAEERKPMRLIQQSVAKEDPDSKAVSCYRLYVPEFDQMWLGFVKGQHVSAIKTRFLRRCTEKFEAIGKKVLLLIWENASWHISEEVRRWLAKHNARLNRVTQE
jgi:hypothetical protein